VPLTLDAALLRNTVSRRASAQEDLRLLTRYRRRHEEADLEALVARFGPLARQLAHRYPHGGEREDIEQVAMLGLLKAIERFDPGRGIAFSSYAVPTILGELKRYFRDQGWTVRVPRSLQELSQAVVRAADELRGTLGRNATVAEIAARCHTTEERVLEARLTVSAHRADSLDRPVQDLDEPECLVNRIGGEDPGYARIDSETAFDDLLSRLPRHDQDVLELRFRHDLKQRQIAKQLGVSQMGVSRSLARSLNTLAHGNEYVSDAA
jgi:RNA polymerase sigma-B factor